jgi:UTP--glucose-1-phosphate uridylyltransferase
MQARCLSVMGAARRHRSKGCVRLEPTITKAIIPAAGLGTRLYPATKSQPKEMLPLGPKPVVQMVAEELARCGISDILVVTGQKKRAIEDHFDPQDGLQPDNEAVHRSELFHSFFPRFYYVRQSTPRGLGDAVLQGENFVGADHFVVALGDCAIVGGDEAPILEVMLAEHLRSGAAATIAVQPVSPEQTSRYGIVSPAGEFSRHMRIDDIVEKPGPEHAPSNLAVCARYIFSPAIFSYLKQGHSGLGGELQLTDAVRAMVHDGHPVYVAPLAAGERRLDVGSFASYGRAFVRALLGDPEFGPGFGRYLDALVAHLHDPTTPDPDSL